MGVNMFDKFCRICGERMIFERNRYGTPNWVCPNGHGREGPMGGDYKRPSRGRPCPSCNFGIMHLRGNNWVCNECPYWETNR